MTDADRNRAAILIRSKIDEAEEQFARLDQSDNKAAQVLASGWLRVAQVWREKLAEVQR